MSVIEDSRKLVQDFLAPELREISTRLDALEKRHESLDKKVDQVDQRAEKRHAELNSKIDQVDQRAEKRHAETNSRFDQVDQRAEKRHAETNLRFDQVDQRAERRYQQTLSAISDASEVRTLRERVARLEERDKPPQ